MQIEFSVERKGTAAGSVGWLAEVLQGATAEFTHTTRGFPAITIKAVVNKKAYSEILALKDHERATYPDGIATFDKLMYAEQQTYFGAWLSSTAFERLSEVAAESAVALREWIEEDDDLEIEVEFHTRKPVVEALGSEGP